MSTFGSLARREASKRKESFRHRRSSLFLYLSDCSLKFVRRYRVSSFVDRLNIDTYDGGIGRYVSAYLRQSDPLKLPTYLPYCISIIVTYVDVGSAAGLPVPLLLLLLHHNIISPHLSRAKTRTTYLPTYPHID